MIAPSDMQDRSPTTECWILQFCIRGVKKCNLNYMVTTRFSTIENTYFLNIEEAKRQGFETMNIWVNYNLSACCKHNPQITYLYYTTLTNNTICDISIKHFGWRQIPGLGVDGRWSIIEAVIESTKSCEHIIIKIKVIAWKTINGWTKTAASMNNI